MARTKIGKKLREIVVAKFGGRCGYCGHKPKFIEIDHIHPVAHAHRLMEKHYNDPTNLIAACAPCNNFKHIWSLEEFREQLGKQIERARARSVNFRLAERYGQIQVIESAPIIFHFERSGSPDAR